MKVKDFDRAAPIRYETAPARAVRRQDNRLGFGAAALGVVCVAAVFALLGLLYSIG